MAHTAVMLFMASFADFNFAGFDFLIADEYPRGVAATLFFVLYIIIVTILLLNILIAMMCKEHKEKKRKIKKKKRGTKISCFVQIKKIN